MADVTLTIPADVAAWLLANSDATATAMPPAYANLLRSRLRTAVDPHNAPPPPTRSSTRDARTSVASQPLLPQYTSGPRRAALSNMSITRRAASEPLTEEASQEFLSGVFIILILQCSRINISFSAPTPYPPSAASHTLLRELRNCRNTTLFFATLLTSLLAFRAALLASRELTDPPGG